jgi:hypothetical protein
MDQDAKDADATDPFYDSTAVKMQIFTCKRRREAELGGPALIESIQDHLRSVSSTIAWAGPACPGAQCFTTRLGMQLWQIFYGSTWFSASFHEGEQQASPTCRCRPNASGSLDR